MAKEGLNSHRIGWVGAGRMGYAMAKRLLDGGVDMAVWNRTRDKAEPLAKDGAKIVDQPADLADRDIVFSVLATSKDVLHVATGPNGVLSVKGKAPRIVVDCTSISAEASAEVRRAADKIGTKYLAAPVSGNAKVVKAGKLTFAVSGPKDAFETVRPYLDALGTGASYVGEGELARIVKICHNVLLGVVIQSLAEITVLAEKSGVPRHAFLDFLNKSVMGSMFTRYKTPALVNLDYSMTFYARAAAQGPRPRPRAGTRARRADAARRGGARDRAVAHRQRLRRQGFRVAAVARGQGGRARSEARERQGRDGLS